MSKFIAILILVSVSISCKKEDELYATDFSDLDGWTTNVLYDTSVSGDTSWVDIVNNQLVLSCIHKEASLEYNYATATYDFSNLDIDPNGIYNFEIGVISPGVRKGETPLVDIRIQFDSWVFSCKDMETQTLSEENIKIQLDLSNHTHVVTRLSNNEDISSTFTFYETTSLDPSYEIQFRISTFCWFFQCDNSIEAKFDHLKISKVKD
jgi:hypothetical protein